MTSFQQPNMQSYLADGAIPYGKAVKIGSSRTNVAVCSANTDDVIGVCQTRDVTAAGDTVEVAMPGGGAAVLLAEAASAGQVMVPHTDGGWVKPNALGDNIGVQILEDGVIGDIVAATVVVGKATAAE